MRRTYNLTLNDIPRLAKDIAAKLKGGEVLGLIGDLGTGKTAFVKALAKHLQVKNPVTSPTFVLMNVFPAVLPKKQKKILLLHLDLYRTKNSREITSLGLSELWHSNDAVTVIEWADKIIKHLPKHAWVLNFHHAKLQ